MKHFVSELQRRSVFKSILVYLGLSWLLLQVIAVLSNTLSLHPLLGSGLLVLMLCGLPIVIYLAWYFEFSLSGVKATASLNEQETSTVTPGIKQWAGLALVLLLSGYLGVAYYGSIKQQWLATQQAEAEALIARSIASSIAVLPFTDISPAQNQSYLALGLAEEITSLLGSAGNFKVSASRSSQFLSEQGLSAQQIGQRLQVATVLTGSVQASENRLNVRVELVDVNSGSTLWSNNYARNVTDAFDIEQDIGRSVVNLLQDKYAEGGSLLTLDSTRNADAYVLYLKGREQYRKQTTEAMQQARLLFEQALALDPEYARGYVGLADTLVLLAETPGGFGVIKTDIATSLAQQNIDNAMSRQPENAEAHAVKGVIAFVLNEFEQAINHYDNAIELNPSLAIAYMWKFLALNSLQRFDESLLALQKAHELDPLFLTSSYNLGMTLTKFGRFNEAEAIFQQIKIDYPESTFSYQGLADLYFSQGNLVGTIREAKLASQVSPDDQRLALKLIGQLLNLGLASIVKQLEKDPNLKSTVALYQPTFFVQEQNFVALFDHLAFSVAASPDDYWVQFEAGWYYSMFGDKPQAVTLFIENSNHLNTSDLFAMPHCSPAIEIAWAQLQLGHQEIAHSLINQCKALQGDLASKVTYFELYYLAARINALQGQPIDAVKALKKAIDSGWREYWTKHDPLLASLIDNTEFQQLLQFLDEDLARQKAEVLTLFAEEFPNK
ncbi:tetratricopeptide repeat protein [Arsukibacterium sp.]|uniref:tetratricopeptide repeat protein n=1 Tax=Arsukibacterium sp. TaxID=1977258 RepID=UPI002FD92EA7